MEKMITIGRLSKITGVSARCIRHYETIGLLTCPANTDSNYRLYGKAEIRKLQDIALLRSLDFSLGEIAEIVNADENLLVSKLFEERLLTLHKEISRLQRSKDILTAVTTIYKMQGLQYINNFHIVEEMITMSTKFGNIFSRLEVALQIKILKELYNTGTLLPETVKEIGSDSGQVLLNELHMVMVKALLNKSSYEVEKNIMMELEKQDIDFCNSIKKALFTFEDISLLPDDTISQWLTMCDDDELCLALADSGNYLKSKILNNMSEERALRLKKIMDSQDAVSLDQEYLATNHLLEILQKMEEDNIIALERF
jgi:DNA-binding transcriptional MerR regulator